MLMDGMIAGCQPLQAFAEEASLLMLLMPSVEALASLVGTQLLLCFSSLCSKKVSSPSRLFQIQFWFSLVSYSPLVINNSMLFYFYGLIFINDLNAIAMYKFRRLCLRLQLLRMVADMFTNCTVLFNS